MLRKKILISLIALLFLVPTFTLVEGMKNADISLNTKPLKEEKPVLHLGINAYCIGFAWYLAQEKGWWDEYDITVDFKFFVAGIPHMYAIAAGDVNIGTAIGDAPPIYVAAQELFPLKIIGMPCESTPSYFVVAKPEIKSIRDLKGKKVGVMKGSNLELVFLWALKKYGMSPEDVELVNLETPDIYAALKAGKLDAGVPHPFHAWDLVNKYGYHIIFSGAELDKPPNPVYQKVFDCQVVNEDWAKDHKELILKALAVYYRAVEYWKTHVDEVIDWVLPIQNKYMGMNMSRELFYWWYRVLTQETLEDQLAKWFNRSYPANQWDNYKARAQVLYEWGKISKIPDFEKVIDPTYVYELYNLKMDTLKAISDTEKYLMDKSKEGNDISGAIPYLEAAKEYYKKWNFWKASEQLKKAKAAVKPISIPPTTVTKTITVTTGAAGATITKTLTELSTMTFTSTIEIIPLSYWIILIIIAIVIAIIAFYGGTKKKTSKTS